MFTHITFAKPSILCRFIGHTMKLQHVDMHGDSKGALEPIEYHECRFCKTRQAVIAGRFNANLIDYRWLREKFDGRA